MTTLETVSEETSEVIETVETEIDKTGGELKSEISETTKPEDLRTTITEGLSDLKSSITEAITEGFKALASLPKAAEETAEEPSKVIEVEIEKVSDDLAIPKQPRKHHGMFG